MPELEDDFRPEYFWESISTVIHTIIHEWNTKLHGQIFRGKPFFPPLDMSTWGEGYDHYHAAKNGEGVGFFNPIYVE